MRASLDRALEWSASHPRVGTDLNALAAKTKRRRSTPMPVRLDVNNPIFQEHWFSLEKKEQLAVPQCCRKLTRLEWEAIYCDQGLQWELIQSRKGSDGERIYSIRITKKVRAVVKRAGDFPEFLTLHEDHDSAHR